MKQTTIKEPPDPHEHDEHWHTSDYITVIGILIPAIVAIAVAWFGYKAMMKKDN